MNQLVLNGRGANFVTTDVERVVRRIVLSQLALISKALEDIKVCARGGFGLDFDVTEIDAVEFTCHRREDRSEPFDTLRGCIGSSTFINQKLSHRLKIVSLQRITHFKRILGHQLLVG